MSWRNKLVDRVCRRCRETFQGKYNSTSCPECKGRTRYEKYARFKEENPAYWREWQNSPVGQESRKKARLKRYGLTPECYDRLMSQQGDACGICGAKPGQWVANGGNLVVDHDHATGAVRGLLCPSCNRGLGQFEDDTERLLEAVQYLQREIDRRKAAQ